MRLKDVKISLLEEEPSYLFFVSCLLSTIGTIVLASFWKGVSEAPITRGAYSLIKIIDPILLHIVSGLLLAVLIIKYRLAAGKKRIGTVMLGIGLPFGFLILEYIMETLWIKPIFNFPRPSGSLPETWLTSWVMQLLNSKDSSSTPSGFVMRQLWLLLGTLIVLSHIDRKAKTVFKARMGFLTKSTIFLNILFLFLVAFQRVVLRRHTLLDVGLAIGLGNALFWLVLIFYNAVISVLSESAYWRQGKDYVSSYLGYFLVLSSLVYFCTEDARGWKVFSMAIFMIIAASFIMSTARRQGS